MSATTTEPRTQAPLDLDGPEGPAPVRRSQGRLVAGVAVVALVAGGVGWVAADGGSASEVVDVAAAPVSTAVVSRTDIVTTASLDGTLTYAGAATVASGRSGTITWLPEVGATISFGQALFEVDGRPVVLLPGSDPAYRDLADGVDDGDDVEVLEQALMQLGYAEDADLTVDREFTSVTADVVETFREDVGLSELDSGDDELALGEVVYAPDLVRVSGVQLSLGDRVAEGTNVLSTTGSDRVVEVALETADQDLVAEGDDVVVELPDGDEVPATVTDVAAVARAVEGTGQDAGTTSVIDVEVTLADGGERFDEAPVSVVVTDSVATGVLTVPVEAVLALAEGGYALEVVSGDATQLMAVELGAFSEGLVEVRGPDVTEGLTVVSA